MTSEKRESTLPLGSASLHLTLSQCVTGNVARTWTGLDGAAGSTLRPAVPRGACCTKGKLWQKGVAAWWSVSAIGRQAELCGQGCRARGSDAQSQALIRKVAFPAPGWHSISNQANEVTFYMMDKQYPQTGSKPLAGTCLHKWRDQESPYVVAEVCSLCMLFRYKPGSTADWEYRAPIPVVGVRPSEPGA